MKLRVGIILWLLSWIPYGIVLGLDGLWLTVTLAFEITLGIVGLALAGTEFGQAVKEHGWKGAPKVAWNVFWRGSESVSAPVPGSP